MRAMRLVVDHDASSPQFMRHASVAIGWPLGNNVLDGATQGSFGLALQRLALRGESVSCRLKNSGWPSIAT
jgi:hypothetical protein